MICGRSDEVLVRVLDMSKILEAFIAIIPHVA